MASVPKNIIPAQQIAASATAYYTAPTKTACRILNLVVTNPTGGAVTVTIYKVPSGGSADGTNTIYSAHSVAAAETWSAAALEHAILDPGDAIYALASAATSLVIEGSGLEITGLGI